MITQELLDREFPNAVKCVDALLEFYREEGYNRLSYVRACAEGTMDLPGGEVMTAISSAVMFERLLEQTKGTTPTS